VLQNILASFVRWPLASLLDVKMPLEASPDAEKPNINMKKYAGLLHEIGAIKDHVEMERERAKQAQESLKERMKAEAQEANAVQKELSVQLRCAGRSYQQLLNACRELQEALDKEKLDRESDLIPYIEEIKRLKKEANKGDGPWKQEIAKRDLKIAKLQEAAAEQEERLREAMAAVEPVRLDGERRVKAEQERTASIQGEIANLKFQLKEVDEVWEEKLKEIKSANHKEVIDLKIKLKDHEEESSKIAGPYIRQIKELELQKQQLEVQLSKVDYAPFEEQVKLKEIGYDRLISDFRTKEQTHSDNVDRMREGFEEVIERLDRKLQSCDKDYQKKLEPWAAMVSEKEDDIKRLHEKIQVMKDTEGEARTKIEAELEETKLLLTRAKEGIDILNNENTDLRQQIVTKEEEENAPGAPKNRFAYMEFRLDEVTKRCQILIKARDRELAEKTALITKLQKRVLEQAKENLELERKWDERVMIKEEGYGIVVAQLKHAEGQILEERERTAAAKKEIKKRDQRIAELGQEHAEELKCRLKDRKLLAKRIRQLEAELNASESNEDEIRKHWEATYDALRLRSEQREADLEIEIVRRDQSRAAVEKELLTVRGEFEKARMTWEGKERELEVLVRARDRLVNALKNEIELVAESWEIKYNKLMSLFDKLQKKYDELMGPGGLAEALRRTRDLKEENVQLSKKINELKEMLKKQKRRIRDLELDIDMHLKETADLIRQKELGIAEMAGDQAKLQAELRKTEEAKERIQADLLGEKRALAASFQARIEQLEQLVEAMRFTDREELMDTIDVWKRAYERVCIARDEMEEEYQGLILTKDKQLRKMALDNSEERAKVDAEIIKWQEKIQVVEEDWKKKLVPPLLENSELKNRIVELERDLIIKDLEIRRMKNLAESRLEDPEKDALKLKVQQLQLNVDKSQAGIQELIKENDKVREEAQAANNSAEGAAEDWGPQIRWRDERHEAMLKEHEQVKEILFREMVKAQETCKQIEEQVRRFPNPFEAEIKEMKDRYAQMQAGMQKLSVENLQLQETLIDKTEAFDEEKRQLEDQIRIAHHILQQISTLGALKSLSKNAVAAMEEKLGMDLNQNGKID